MKRQLLLMAGLGLVGSYALSDVIISEYIEGSSNNKALELMNTGSTTADLSTYQIELYSNGKLTIQSTLSLSGTLEPGQVLVIGNSQAEAAIKDIADVESGVTSFNGDDHIVLRNDGAVVDRLGQLGVQVDWGEDITLVRNEDVTSGDPQFDMPFDATIGWTSYPQNTFSFLGNGDSGGGGEVDPPLDLTCAAEATFVSSIQGNGSASPMDGSKVVVEGIVTSDLQDTSEMRGFFLQEEDADADADSATSEGVFVYYTSSEVNVGDAVRVEASVDEFYGLTQLTDVLNLVICSTGNALPTTTSVSLPLESADGFETVEGMLVGFTNQLTVNEVFNLGRYGEFLASYGRRFIPTDIAAPGPEADAVHAANDLNLIIVEDGIRYQNPEPVVFPAPGLDAYNTLRVGNTVDNLVGIMNYAFGAYKLIPTSAPTFNNDNPRVDAPDAVEESSLRLASFNVLNFFNGDGIGGGFPTPRGADDAYELERQTAKLVAAINTIDADVVGLMEIENDGFDEFSAIAELTNALNAELAAEDQYVYVDANVATIGDDAIAVGIIYRPTVVSLAGTSAILSTANSPLNDSGEPLFVDDLNRPALAQSFTHVSSGDVMTVVVNHLKSKGSSNCDTRSDCDEGQGAYNIARTNAAEALAIWLAGNPTGVVDSDVMIMGDLNAYSKEDPISMLMENGYTLIKADGGYSYVFSGETGSLDHALASSSLLGKVINVQDWHINTDEPRILDYNTEFKSETQIQSMFAPTPFRSSDHDPVIIDFEFNQAPTAKIAAYPFFFWYIFVSESSDNDGELVKQTWTLGEYEIERSWFAVPKRFVHKNHIQDVSLTVEDDKGAVDTDSLTFRKSKAHRTRK